MSLLHPPCREGCEHLDKEKDVPGHDIIVVGASAGGIEALTQLVSKLPSNLPGTLFVVLHIPAESPSLLPQILSRFGPLPASHPADGEQIKQGHIYIAPPDYHLLVEQGYTRVVRGPKENRHRPAIDPLFRSAARAYGPRVVGVVLTGMLDDGTAGLLAIKRRKGLAVVQEPQEALYPSMPQSACNNVEVDYCVPVAEIGPLLVHLAHKTVEEGVTGPGPEDLDKEVRIAEMETNALNNHEQIGKPSAFSCPECGGVLWEVQDSDFLRFRCRVGHALSAESVLAAQTEEIDKALWHALKALEEKASLSRRMARKAHERGSIWLERQLEKNIQEAENDARLLHQVLLNSPDTKEKISQRDEQNGQ